MQSCMQQTVVATAARLEAGLGGRGGCQALYLLHVGVIVVL